MQTMKVSAWEIGKNSGRRAACNLRFSGAGVPGLNRGEETTGSHDEYDCDTEDE